MEIGTVDCATGGLLRLVCREGAAGYGHRAVIDDDGTTFVRRRVVGKRAVCNSGLSIVRMVHPIVPITDCRMGNQGRGTRITKQAVMIVIFISTVQDITVFQDTGSIVSVVQKIPVFCLA